MAEDERHDASGRNSPAASRSLMFGPAPILPGEDPAAYNELLVEVSSSLKPTDTVAEIYVRDYTDHTWQINQMRRRSEAIIAMQLPRAIGETLRKTTQLSERRIKTLTRNYRAGKPGVTQDIEKCLVKVNMTFDAVVAQAFANALDQLERIDRLITLAEGRRNLVLRELERHRASAAQKLREEIHQFSEILELEKIESGPIAPDPAAPDRARAKGRP